MAQILQFPAAAGFSGGEASRQDALPQANAGSRVSPAAFRKRALAEQRVYVAALHREARIRQRRMHVLAFGLIAAIIATGAAL